MNKEQLAVKDYLHLYLGCDIKTETGIVKLYAVTKEIVPCTEFGVIVLNGNVTHKLHNIEGCKLFLRPLSDMTEEEFEIFEKLTRLHPLFDEDGIYEMSEEILNNTNPKTFQYALSKHFDLFGLIEAGLAIDATTIKQSTCRH